MFPRDRHLVADATSQTINVLRPDVRQTSDDIDQASFRREVRRARKRFARSGWLLMDTTRRLIEQTAATIPEHVASHCMGNPA
jgi:regulator of PEP synthase PpsR (kinase-PPPase family)